MIRRFNYTGRKKILRDDVPISLTGEKPLWSFNADLGALITYDLPLESRVYVEAYEQTSYMRFDFGTIGNIKSLSPENRVLTEFEGSDGVRFRVKVVDASPDAKLLGEADGILPLSPEEAEQNKLPLLPIRSHDLGQEVWRIDFQDGVQDRPTLLVNQYIDDRTAFVRSPAFMSLAWPALLREILVKILVIDKHQDTDELGEWRSMWLNFAKRFVPGKAIPADIEMADEWISEAVSAFTARHTLLAKFKEHEDEEAHA